MILAITFIVIVVTLAGQGLLLPTVIRWLGLAKDVAIERSEELANELAARSGAIRAALARIEKLALDSALPADLIDGLREHHGARLRELLRAQEESDRSHLADEMAVELIDAQRRHIHEALRDGSISDESRRLVERDLDLLEVKTRQDFRAVSSGV
jgi:CPA1 family monovalent cation:H+ antiporter